MDVFLAGSRPTGRGDSTNFTGTVWRDLIVSAPDPCRVRAGFARFEPRARTAWHTHPLGQTLCILFGIGCVQAWGEKGYLVRGGDVVWIPPGEKHWHGAHAGSTMTYIAIQQSDDRDIHVDWLEHVTDEQFEAALRTCAPG